MVFALFKWLTWLCMPYTLIMLGLVATGVWLIRRRVFRPAICVFSLAVLMFAGGLPLVSATLGHALERQCPPTPLDDIPPADAIVVLGGGVAEMNEERPYPELYPAADRAIMAVRLFRAGKAPIVIPTGVGAERAEKPLMEDLGVPASSIVCESEARDTAENASKTFALLRERGCKKVLLVTSAWHMPRAKMLFKADDITFIPVGCDYENTPYAPFSAPLWMQLPGPEAAGKSVYYIKELLGILFYSIRTPPAQ